MYLYKVKSLVRIFILFLFFQRADAAFNEAILPADTLLQSNLVNHQVKQKEHFIHLTSKDGLSHNNINSIFQDKRGFIWISTTDGLNCYDGKNFKSFFHTDRDSSSPATNNFGKIIEDENGNLIIASGVGVCMYLPLQNKFKMLFVPESKFSKDRGITNIIFDKQGHLWAATRFEVYELDSSFKVMKIFKEELYGTDIIFDIAKDKQGNIWINKSGFQNMFSSVTHDIFNKNNNPQHKVIFESNKNSPITFDSQGNIWTIENRNTLVKYNSDGNLQRRNELIKQMDPTFLLLTRDERIFVASRSSGIFIFNPATNEVKNCIHNLGDFQSLTNNDVKYLFEDNLQNIWVGTTEGLNVLPYQPCKLQVWDQLSYYNDGITNNEIRRMALFNHSLWIALWGKGLCRIDLIRDKKEVYETGISDLDKMVWDIMPLNNEVLFGTFHGLHRFNPITKKISDFRNYAGYTKDLDSLAIIDISSDSHERIWMSLADDKGLLCYHKKEAYFERFSQHESGKYYFPFRHFSAMAESADGRLWFGYNRSYGLVTYDTLGRKFIMVTRNEKPAFNDQINCFLADGSYLWIGSNSGLYKMNLLTYELNHYSRNEGLPNDLVHAISKDNYGKLWISTENGLAEFEPRTSSIINFNEELNIPENNINNSLYDTQTHRLYLNTLHSIFSFCTDSLKRKSTKLFPQVISIRVIGKETMVDPDSTIQLDYDDKYFSFEFTAPYFPDGKNIKYAYKLDGFDKDWVFIGNRQYAGYTNLRYGNYAFYIIASVNGKNWDLIQKPLKINISAPFYFQSWFTIICVVAAIIISGLLFYINYRIKLQRILLTQQIRNKIAGDLHDDIGSSLSSISFMSEVAKQKLKVNTAEAENYFNMIGESSRALIENMSDIVWSINPKNDTFENILSRMRKFSSTILEAKGIDLDFKTSPGIENRKLSMDQRRNLYLIFKEIINNMAKHAACKNVRINFSEEHVKIILEITDDGKGFEVDKNYEGNGLKNMKKRAEELNGELKIESKTGQGSIFILRL